MAARFETELAGPVVDLEAVLEITELAIGAGMVAQGGAAGLQRLFQNRADGLRERAGAARRERAGEAARRQPGPEQGLADIDIAEARNDLLVEQRRLERGLAPRKYGRQEIAAEFVAERLDPQPLEKRVLEKLGTAAQQHEAEAARIVIGDAGAGIGGQHNVIVRRKARAFVVEAAGKGALDPERARHSEMRDQNLPVIEVEQQIFGAPRQRGDGPAFEARREAGRKGKTQILAPHLGGRDPVAQQSGLQPAADGFDFGKFGHVKTVVGGKLAEGCPII